MSVLDDFRSPATSATVARAIAAEVDPQRRYSFMEFCGSHTHTIARHSLEEVLPANVRMVHGPG